MDCSWCGSVRGVRLAQSHAVSPSDRCPERSPFTGEQCGDRRGHLSACKPPAPSQPVPLCVTCFGIWQESGERPPAYRFRAPQAGPLGGRPVDLRRLRG